MQIIIAIYIFILGTIFASFFGVIIDRVPKAISIVLPASKCDNCGHVLKWYENIPIFSYLFLRGKCAKCKVKIDPFLFIYEIIGGLVLLSIYLKFGLSWQGLIISVIGLLLLLIAGYDYKTKAILNIFLYLLSALSIILFVYRIVCLKEYYLDYLISLVIGFLFFFTIKLVVSKILKKEAMGDGDIYLASIMALCFEPLEFLMSISLASIIGSIITLILIGTKKLDKEAEIPFCPYLCLGFYIVFIFGDFLIKFLVG